MRNKRRCIFFICLLGLSCFLMPVLSTGEDIYPAKNINWLIPYKPGGGFDVFARAISPFMEKHLKNISPKSKGGAIAIKNEPAAAGEKAISILFNSHPDGYTIGSFTGAFLAEKFLTKKDYDISKLTYLVRVDEMTRLLVAGKSGPRDWNELIAASKVKPIKWGVGAFGREIHITSIIMNEVLGVPAKLIAFGGTAESLNALLRGDVQIVTVSDDSAKAMVDAGEIRVLVSFDKKSVYPGARSVQDLGHPELINPTQGNRFLAGPPGLPKNVGDTIVEGFQRACKDAEFAAWYKKSGFEPDPVYGKDLDRLVIELTEFFSKKAPVIKKYLD